jgi:hypothetical protein
MKIKTSLVFFQRQFFNCLCALLFLVSCQPAANNQADENILKVRIDKADKCIDSAKFLIKDYDIITRTGTDFTSRGLRNLCFTDQSYSHCGIAHYENDTLFIYHAVGGESSPDEALHRDLLEVYASGSDNEGLGIFRFNLPDASVKYRIDSLIKLYYAEKIKFDLQFDLSTDDKMYCAEFVAKVFSRAFKIQNMFATHTIQHKEYLAPDDIYLHKECREVKRFSYY